ncbi:MAG: hypothetical protein ACUVXJ_15465, partial [Phycisphaerae bacterium]
HIRAGPHLRRKADASFSNVLPAKGLILAPPSQNRRQCHSTIPVFRHRVKGFSCVTWQQAAIQDARACRAHLDFESLIPLPKYLLESEPP